jgi:hypothetical protein
VDDARKGITTPQRDTGFNRRFHYGKRLSLNESMNSKTDMPAAARNIMISIEYPELPAHVP